MNYKIFTLLLIFFTACSSFNKREVESFYWVKNKEIHYDNKEEFARCFNIKPDEIDNHIIFKDEVKIKNGEDYLSSKIKLKDKIADGIVDLIIIKLQRAFGEDILTKWQLESTTLPVKFRTFIKPGSEFTIVREVALVKSDDMKVKSLIRFLPLEYKMQFMDDKDRRNFSDPIPILD